MLFTEPPVLFSTLNGFIVLGTLKVFLGLKKKIIVRLYRTLNGGLILEAILVLIVLWSMCGLLGGLHSKLVKCHC